MRKTRAWRELPVTRLEIPNDMQARSKGRNGYFRPRAIDAVIHIGPDDALLVTQRQYSRRAPSGDEAPLELTMPATVYAEFVKQIDAVLLQILTNGKRPTAGRRRRRAITG